MEVKTFVLIVLAEGLALSLLALVGLFAYVQRLKRQLKKARRAQQNVPKVDAEQEQPAAVREVASLDAQASKSNQLEARTDSHSHSYTDFIDQQIDTLVTYHGELPGAGDISLDIDPSAPLERRIAAVRHAVLIAEREATVSGDVEWSAVKIRYKQLLQYYEDFPSPKLEAKLEELTSNLKAAQGQVAGLEKYRQLYFDLENQWHQSREEAGNYYQQLLERSESESGVDSDGGSGGTVELLNNYHRSYERVTTIFDEQSPVPADVEAAKAEINELRRMTSEQCRVIDKLKQQISSANSDNEKVSLIRELEQQLDRQERFMKESESCVKLMEDELSAVHKELQSVKAKLKELPNVKAQLRDLTEDNGVAEVMIARLKADVEQLRSGGGGSELAAQASSLGGDSAARASELEQELETLRKQYADLEERFLDLKLEG